MSRIVAATLVSCALGPAVLACGSATPPPAEAPAAEASAGEASAAEPSTGRVAAPPAAEAPQCVDEKDQRVRCISDTDCCPRFVCGKDPDLSQSATYCIFGG